jgi:large subunit ribosomal protein L10
MPFFFPLTYFPAFDILNKVKLNKQIFRRNQAFHKSWRGNKFLCLFESAGKQIFIFMLTRPQKEELVKNLAEMIKGGKVLIFSDYAGTSVAKMKNLRDALRESGSSYKITKKKLIDLALKNAGIEASVLDLEGQIGIAIGKEDEVTAAKVLAKFAKENKNFKILRGVLENKVISGQEVASLAMLPSKEELLARVVGTINAPISGFVNALAGNLRNLVGVLKAIGETK